MKLYEWALVAGVAVVAYKLLFGDRERPAYGATGAAGGRARPASPPGKRQTHDSTGAAGGRARPASPPGKRPGDGGTGAEGADPENADADASAPQGGDAKAVWDRASPLIGRQKYSRVLDLLESTSQKILTGTPIVEDLLLMMIKNSRLRHRTDREFAKAIGLHEPRMLKLVESVIRARSLDVQINRSLDKYRSLVDYVSRVRLGRESMLGDPEFWPWLDGGYPHVAKLLRNDERLVTSTNSFVQMLSTKFRHREMPHVEAYMRAVDALCLWTMEICSIHACDYAKKANEDWGSAEMEMVVLVATSRHFRIKRIDPEIPNSAKLADMSFERDDVDHYVEVYSYADYDLAGSEIKIGIVPEDEWELRFKKSQIRSMREVDVPTVYVMKLDDFQAQRGETESPAFREKAAEMMPGDSDIVVIIRGKAEAASLRGGRIVETSDLATLLRDEIEGAMPENAAGARP